jgi:hypothetical protein
MHDHQTSTSVEDPDRRESRRIKAPMTVVIGKTPYAIDNWSLRGMKIANYYGALQPPDRAKIRFWCQRRGQARYFRPWRR